VGPNREAKFFLDLAEGLQDLASTSVATGRQSAAEARRSASPGRLSNTRWTRGSYVRVKSAESSELSKCRPQTASYVCGIDRDGVLHTLRIVHWVVLRLQTRRM
jgi:hypothetical protein